MLIGVMSDSHDNMPMVNRAVRLFREREAEHLCHAGDIVSPFVLKLVLASGLPFTGVVGNNDGEIGGLTALTDDLHAPPHEFSLAGRRILMTHRPLAPEARQGFDLVIYGHTHEAELTHATNADGGARLDLNPGESGGWLTGRCTVAVVDLDALDAELIEIGTQETYGP